MEILAWWIYGSLILLTLFLVGGVARVFLPPRLPKVREAACASCRYPVRGLGDWKCPECGTDLRVGGILTPRLRHRARARLAGGIVSWVLLMGVVGLFTAQATVWRMVHEVRTQAGVTQKQIALRSSSRRYREVIIAESVNNPNDGSDPTRIVELSIDGRGTIEVDPETITSDEVIALYSSLNIDPESPQTRAEADEVARIVRSIDSGSVATRGVFWGTSTSISQRMTGPVRVRYDINPWLYGIGGGWLAVFLGGLWFMVWWRGRQRVRAQGA
ncbi:MAG: hypothetical protein H6812_07765 [Phycisphaeraceae bacterium]|nr:hypothetical protein [Phycisphaerales bacterium]MCB9843141.1 hypothetical protein [Phycisphaeraceae bacterium]